MVNVRIPALEKLLDYTASGIGSIAGPMLAPWKAKQEAKARLIAVQGKADALQVIATAQADARERLVSADYPIEGELDIAETVSQRIRFQEEKKQRNIGAVVGQAAEELEGKEVQDHEPDHDWTARFFNEVQDVSSEEMRVLWARILAGEVERPGNTSIQTLSILRNMARRDAELFVKFCGFCWNIGRVTPLIYDVESEIYTNHGINFDALWHLESLGLIRANAF